MMFSPLYHVIRLCQLGSEQETINTPMSATIVSCDAKKQEFMKVDRATCKLLTDAYKKKKNCYQVF